MWYNFSSTIISNYFNMKRIFSNLFIVFVFIVGVIIVSVHKTEAGAVTAWIKANGVSSLTVLNGVDVTITWGSSGASSCVNNFNSSSSTSGSYTYTATSSQSYWVRCTNGMVYYQLSPCNSGNIAAEYYTSAGSWSSGTLVQGASGVYYRIAGSNENDDPSKTNVAGITSETNQALCK